MKDFDISGSCCCLSSLTLNSFSYQLAELQSKVRSEVISEYWLRLWCANPDKKLFDWGMTRLRRPLYGIGDAFAMEADDSLKKKRDAEVSGLSSSNCSLVGRCE